MTRTELVAEPIMDVSDVHYTIGSRRIFDGVDIRVSINVVPRVFSAATSA
jgi:ABC-type transporter Mla maintaining outer membrane lipid asymmetry ATPase subunit MlaF